MAFTYLQAYAMQSIWEDLWQLVIIIFSQNQKRKMFSTGPL